ncbi:MAG: glycosyltransferase [Granulosicoccaceae bacterium]
MTKNAASKDKIVFCIEALSVGGAEQMLVAMANQFADDGWLVHMVCLSKAGELADGLNAKVTLHVLDKKPGVDIGLPSRLRSLVKTINPYTVNSHLWTANLWARLSLIGSGYRVFVTEHSRDFWKSWYHRLIDQLLAGMTKKLVAVSNDTADFYRKDIGIRDGLVTVINNGVDTERYAAGSGAQLRQEWISGNQLLLGTVGRLVEAKNHPRLIEMAALLKQRNVSFKLVIAGDGPNRSTIEALINSHQLSEHVLMLGQRLDIPDLLNALDIFILSSDREGHPLTALEAQAAGTPVILTNAGGSADAIAGTAVKPHGMLVEKSAQALADAVINMREEGISLEERGKQAQEYALAQFDKRQMISSYQQLFLSA